MWQAVRAGFGDDVLLRANGKCLPWNTGVSIEDSDNVSTMMYWTVEPFPVREGTLAFQARFSSSVLAVV